MQKLTPTQAQVFECRMCVDPPRTIKEVARLLGKTVATITNNWTEIRKRIGYDPLKEYKQLGLVGRHGVRGDNAPSEQLRAVNPEVLTRLIEMRAESMLRALSDEKIVNANVGELSRAIRELLSMRQLLRGEPTQILGSTQRAKLSEALPAFLKEAQRRGYSFEIDPGSGEVRTLKALGGTKTDLAKIEAAQAAAPIDVNRS